ncbi:MAG TPA: hypothetical protein VGF43_04155 [Dongiaceae bacterium]|jgi:hypothetical protein
MSERDTEYWGLFENRPAKERTSSPQGEEMERDRRPHETHVWSRLQRRTNTIAERSKC